MPITDFQGAIAKLLAPNRSPDSHLAGASALHLSANSTRYSNDLDYFHDSEQRVAQAFADDRALLEANGYSIEIEMNQPGYIRALVSNKGGVTKIEWAHDSAWRFMPPLKNERVGYQLDPIDIAINKALALAGRDEPRDFLDILHIHEQVLPLGALCWAACGKDPGFSPRSLLELIKRRGRYHREDFDRLHLARPVDLQELKAKWIQALEDAEAFIQTQPAEEVGCLYYSRSAQKFVAPPKGARTDDIVLHFGRPGGVIPEFMERNES